MRQRTQESPYGPNRNRAPTGDRRPHPHAAGRVADRKALKRAFCSSLSPL
jgi:hypothetical protein